MSNSNYSHSKSKAPNLYKKHNILIKLRYLKEDHQDKRKFLRKILFSRIKENIFSLKNKTFKTKLKVFLNIPITKILISKQYLKKIKLKYPKKSLLAKLEQ